MQVVQKNIKIGFSITEGTQEILNNFKKKHKVNMSDVVEKLLRFDEEGLSEYVKMLKMFKEREMLQIKKSDFYLTTNKNEIELAYHTSSQDMRIPKANMAIEYFQNKIDNEAAPSVEEDIITIKTHLVKYLHSLSITAQDNMTMKQEFNEIRKIKQDLEKLRTEYQNLIIQNKDKE